MTNKRRRVSITLDAVLTAYMDDLIEAGLYGTTRSEVVKGFLRDGIIRAIPHVIKIRKFPIGKTEETR